MALPINSRALNDLKGNSEPPPASSDGDPLVGTVVSDRYRVVRKLGEGTQASVYVAKHTLIKRHVALKILSATMAADRDLVKRFLDEGQVAGTMGHPNVVESLDMGATEDGRPFLVLEYLDGLTIADELEAKGRFDIGRACFIGMQIASALVEAHSRGIVHRDLKPENVFLVDKDGHGDHVKVIDFGISKIGNNEGAKSGLIYGTPDYMAPEQVTSPATVDARVDVYALGAMLYEMLSGRMPIDAKSADDPLKAVVSSKPVSLARINPNLPVGLIAIVEKAMHKARSRRTQTITELRDALEPLAMASLPRSSPPASQRFSGVQLSHPPASTPSIPAQLPPPMISSPNVSASISGPATAVTVVDAPPRRVSTALFAGIGGALVAGLAVFFAVKSTTQSHALSAIAVNKIDAPTSGTPAGTNTPNGDPTGVSTGSNAKAPPAWAVKNGAAKGTWPPPPKAPKPGLPVAAEEPAGFVQPAAPPTPVAAPAAAPAPEVAKEAPHAAVPATPALAAAPAVAPTSNKPQPFGEGMSRPSPINPGDIRYPREAIESKTSGVEIVRCTIQLDGSTTGCRVIKSVPFMDAPVLEMLSHHKGSPVMKDGQPVLVEYTFSIKFQAQ